jgi:hypothetical protein
MRLREADERGAARLIQGDVSLAADHMRDILQDGYWLAFYRCDVPQWGDAETLLARALSAEDWEVVSQSALELNRYEETMRQTVGPDGPHPGARQVQFDSPSAQRGLRAIWENATEAYNVLAPLAHNEPWRDCCTRARRRPAGRGPAWRPRLGLASPGCPMLDAPTVRPRRPASNGRPTRRAPSP